MAQHKKPPPPRRAGAPEIDGLGRLVSPENRHNLSSQQAIFAPPPPLSIAATPPRRAPQLTVIDGGLSAWNRRRSRRSRLGEIELLWTVDRVCHAPGDIDFIPQRPPGRGWRIADNGRDRRTLWMRRVPRKRGRP